MTIEAWLRSVAPSDADRIYAGCYLRKPELAAKTWLEARIAPLRPPKLAELDHALRFSLGQR